MTAIARLTVVAARLAVVLTVLTQSPGSPITHITHITIQVTSRTAIAIYGTGLHQTRTRTQTVAGSEAPRSADAASLQFARERRGPRSSSEISKGVVSSPRSPVQRFARSAMQPLASQNTLRRTFAASSLE